MNLNLHSIKISFNLYSNLISLKKKLINSNLMDFDQI